MDSLELRRLHLTPRFSVLLSLFIVFFDNLFGRVIGHNLTEQCCELVDGIPGIQSALAQVLAACFAKLSMVGRKNGMSEFTHSVCCWFEPRNSYLRLTAFLIMLLLLLRGR